MTMKTVVVEKRYLNYKIGEVIQVRDRDAALLISRGVVSEVKEAKPADKPAEKMTTKKVIKK